MRWIRVFALAAIVGVNMVGTATPAQADEGCWDCEWCSDGNACCPTGTLYSWCLAHPQHCHVDPCGVLE
jgi:hypothetical protein